MHLFPPVRLSSASLQLRSVEAGDAARLFECLYQREEVLRWLLWDGPTTLEAMCEYCSRWCVPGSEHAPGEGAEWRFVICAPGAGDAGPWGGLGLRWSESARMGDLGYWVEPTRWRQGVATEAIGLACDWAFESLAAEVLVARVFCGNFGSVRALQKNGFEFTHRASAAAFKRGVPVDLEWYALSAEAHARLRRAHARAAD